MRQQHLVILLCGGAFLVACSEELPPRSVQEFLDDPILLEAAVVRCAQSRAETRYEAECVNARQAVSIIEAREERERAALLEEQSQRKRDALRQTQEAAAEARRRAEEAERLRREAEYLAQFGELPPPEDAADDAAETVGNVPGAVIPDEPATAPAAGNTQDLPATDGSNAPTDLNAVREELRRRGEDDPDET
jgi:hypothetical protein